ncbi:UMP kinase, partial [Candidatus Woesearchaeota archaeon]|nr:UMP kinase [Candidatus Woesearchaeota archaeon]
MKKRVVVFSLGGSLIVPNVVNYNYLHKFKLFVRKLLKNYKVVIVTGGGKTARNYIESLKREGSDETILSLVGIMATKLNARLVA